MGKLVFRAHFALGVLVCGAGLLPAATITRTLGSATPSFTDGQTGIGTATYNSALAGNAAPFNGFMART